MAERKVSRSDAVQMGDLNNTAQFGDGASGENMSPEAEQPTVVTALLASAESAASEVSPSEDAAGATGAAGEASADANETVSADDGPEPTTDAVVLSPEEQARADERQRQREELDAEYPLPPDSAVCDVKYLGRIEVDADPDNPPDGETCSRAVAYLRRQVSRSKFREGIAKQMKIRICARRRLLLAVPAKRPTGPNDTQRGLGFKQSLMQVTCVADHGSHVCYVAGRLNAERELVCHAYAFECENELAARYVAEEVVRACRVLFDRARHVSRARAAAAQKAKKKNKKPREPNESDALFMASLHALQSAVSSVKGAAPPPVHKPRRAADNDDNLFRVCCQQFGKCTCEDAQEAITVEPAPEATRQRTNTVWRKGAAMPQPEGLNVNTRVLVLGLGEGTIRYHGPAHAASRRGGLRFGVELDKPIGNCNGLLPNEGRYFTCSERHGLIFSPGDYHVEALQAAPEGLDDGTGPVVVTGDDLAEVVVEEV